MSNFIPNEVSFVEDELNIFLGNLTVAELNCVKKACDSLLALSELDRNVVYDQMLDDVDHVAYEFDPHPSDDDLSYDGAFSDDDDEETII